LQDLETSFCPEIGDATVGSLTVTTSKDSSIDGPGYLSALVVEVKYVDEVSTAAATAAAGRAGPGGGVKGRSDDGPCYLSALVVKVK
jgi:hypothetical protein